MPSTVSEMRAAVVAEARRWIGTPFHHRQRQLGRGVDCVNLLIAVYSAAGLVPEIELPWYAPDLHLHRDNTLLIDILNRYARPANPVFSGDIAVYGYGRSISHAAIVEDERTIIHAYAPAETVCRSERNSLEFLLASNWTRRKEKPHVDSYWSVFVHDAAAASERIAA